MALKFVLFVFVLVSICLQILCELQFLKRELNLSTDVYSRTYVDFRFPYRIDYSQKKYTKMDGYIWEAISSDIGKGLNSTKYTVKYRIGNRSKGDCLLAKASHSLNFSPASNIQQVFKYPNSLRIFLKITYVHYKAITNEENGLPPLIVEGGINKQSLQIWHEANSTKMFKYKLEIYGYKNLNL